MKRALQYLAVAAVAYNAGCATHQSEPGLYDPISTDAPAFVPDRYKPLYGFGMSVEEVKSFRAALPFDSISLRRTGCLGSCPAYTVTFHRSGKADLEAVHHLPSLGNFTGEVNPFDYGKLCYLIENSRFKEMDKSYRARWTDDAACAVTITEGTNRVEVFEYGRVGPIELWAIQQAIDSVRIDINWSPIY